MAPPGETKLNFCFIEASLYFLLCPTKNYLDIFHFLGVLSKFCLVCSCTKKDIFWQESKIRISSKTENKIWTKDFLNCNFELQKCWAHRDRKFRIF